MILEAIESVNNALSTPPTFIYADLNEANFNVDTLASSVAASPVPVHIVMPLKVKDSVGRSGVLKSSVPLEGFILMAVRDQNTVDFNAREKENEAIAPMRILAREFIYNLNQHAIIDPEERGITEIEYEPVYSTMDANLFGVYYKATVPFMEGITGCND